MREAKEGGDRDGRGTGYHQKYSAHQTVENFNQSDVARFAKNN
jgi:hypothetical protein